MMRFCRCAKNGSEFHPKAHPQNRKKTVYRREISAEVDDVDDDDDDHDEDSNVVALLFWWISSCLVSRFPRQSPPRRCFLSFVHVVNIFM